MKKNLLLIAFTLSILSGYSQTVQYSYLNDNATSFTTTFTASSGVIDRWMIYGKNSTLLDSVVVSTSTGAITYSRTPVIFSYTTALHSLTITNCIIVAFPPNSSYVHPYLDSLLAVSYTHLTLPTKRIV